MCSSASGKDRQSALADHEAHLRHGRPGERGLHRRLGQHDQAAEQRRETADHDEDGENARGQQHDIGEADQQEPACIDHTRMEERRHGRGRLHHLGQPAMGRKLGGLEHRRERQQARRRHRKAAAFSRACGLQDRPISIVPYAAASIAAAPSSATSPRRAVDELLARRALRRDPIGVEQQKPMQKQAGGNPGENQLDEIARGDEQQHRRERHAEPAGEGTLLRLAVQIGPGVANDHPADEGDQKQHRGADGVQPDRQSDPVKPDHGTAAGSEKDQPGRRDESCEQRQKGGGFGRFGEVFGATSCVQEADRRADQQRNGRQQWRELDWHGMSPSRQIAVRGQSYWSV